MSEVHVKDESQVNGVEVEEKTDKLPFEVKGEKDLERLFDEHPKFLDEFNQDPKAFIEKYGDSTEEKPEEKPAQEPAPAEEDKEEDWLKEEPIGEPEKFANEGVEKQLTETNEKLTKALEEIEALKKTATPKEKKDLETDVKDLNIPNLSDLPEDIDLLTDEGQEQAKKHLKSLTEAMKAVSGLMATYKERIDKVDLVEQEVGEIKTKAKERESESDRTNYLANEFKTIDDMVKSHKDVFGEEIRPVKDIEDDYLESIGNMLSEVAGQKEAAVFDKTGQFTDEAKKVIALYTGKTDKAKRFQAKCKELEIGFPKDIEALQTVYEIRAIRDELSQKDEANNVIKPADYQIAVEAYIGRNISKFRTKERVESHTAHDRAIANRKNFAPQTRSGAAVEDEDITKLPKQEVERILNKMPKDRTDMEKELAYKILTSVGEVPEEARRLSGLDIKKE